MNEPSTQPFLDLVRCQRGCREYIAEPVPLDDVLTILDAAVRAPSAHNSQPWEFVVVTDPDVRGAISSLARASWEAGRAVTAAKLEHGLLGAVDSYIGDNDYGGAPVLVVLGVDTNKVNPVVAGSSIYPAAQNLMLAALSLGYATNLTNFTLRMNDELARLLDIPAHIQLFGIVSLGRSVRPLGPSRREPASEHCHVNRFGNRVTGS